MPELTRWKAHPHCGRSLISHASMNPSDVLAAIWQLGGLPVEALHHARLTGSDPVLPSSFAVGTAAQATIAAAALAACELRHARGQPRQDVAVDMTHAALECTGWFSINGRTPDIWDKFSGLYACADGWVRIHANFAHHRNGALRLMGLPPDTASRADAERAMRGWRAAEFEQAAADAGLVVAAVRSFDEWGNLPQGQAIAAQPLMTFERLGDAPPLALPPLGHEDRPLTGVRVLDLTRILAGPVCGRTLAAYGADVMLINAPHLPNIESIADTSRGKLSAHIDLQTAEGRATLEQLVSGSHVFVQGYRPGALQAHGFGPEALSQRRPGVVYVSLSAYGQEGPWAARRGFDSLVQSAMGFNLAEAEAQAQAQAETQAEAQAQAAGISSTPPPQPQTPAHANPGLRRGSSDGLCRLGRIASAADGRGQLACADLAGTSGALASQPGACR